MDLYNSSDSCGGVGVGGGSSCGSSLVILFQAVVPPHIHVIPGITPDQTFVVVVIVGNMAVPIVCPASARPGMMISFHAPLIQNIQYRSSLYQPFQDTDTTNTCNIIN